MELSSSNENLQTFLDYVDKKLKRHRFKLKLSVDELEVNGNSVGGMFDSDLRELVIDFQQEDWLETLVHEFSHFLLYLKNDRKQNKKECEAAEFLWGWLEFSVEAKNPEIKKHLEVVRKMELGAEKMSVKLIKKYKLNVNVSDYIKKANVYVYFYNFVYLHRTWLRDDVGIESMEELLAIVPDTFTMKYNKFDRNLLDLYKPYVK